MVDGGTRISVKIGRYPAGRGGALCSSRSSTVPLVSLETSPRMSSSTETCSSLRKQHEGINPWSGHINLSQLYDFIWCANFTCSLQEQQVMVVARQHVLLAYLMSGYLAASPDTSRASMPGSLSWMKSARTGSKAKGFTSGTDPSPSFNDIRF